MCWLFLQKIVCISSVWETVCNIVEMPTLFVFQTYCTSTCILEQFLAHCCGRWVSYWRNICTSMWCWSYYNPELKLNEWKMLHWQSLKTETSKGKVSAVQNSLPCPVRIPQRSTLGVRDEPCVWVGGPKHFHSCSWTSPLLRFATWVPYEWIWRRMGLDIRKWSGTARLILHWQVNSCQLMMFVCG